MEGKPESIKGPVVDKADRTGHLLAADGYLLSQVDIVEVSIVHSLDEFFTHEGDSEHSLFRKTKSYFVRIDVVFFIIILLTLLHLENELFVADSFTIKDFFELAEAEVKVCLRNFN